MSHELDFGFTISGGVGHFGVYVTCDRYTWGLVEIRDHLGLIPFYWVRPARFPLNPEVLVANFVFSNRSDSK